MINRAFKLWLFDRSHGDYRVAQALLMSIMSQNASDNVIWELFDEFSVDVRDKSCFSQLATKIIKEAETYYATQKR